MRFAVSLLACWTVYATSPRAKAINNFKHSGNANVQAVKFKYYRQVRVHERFSGLSIAEPVHDEPYRSFSLTIDTIPDAQARYRIFRSRGSLQKLLAICEDDDERKFVYERKHNWNDIIRLSKFKYQVFNEKEPLIHPHHIEDVDNIVANVFLSSPMAADPSIVLIALSFPETIRGQSASVELLRTHNSAAMFLCCCGREIKKLRAPACGCTLETNVCSLPCMFHQTPTGGLFYHRTLHIIKYIRQLHPDSTLWVTGFGFCGALASLVVQAAIENDGDRYIGAVTFHAPGEFWFAKRQNLYASSASAPSSILPIYNIGITSNPIFASSSTSGINEYGNLYYETGVRSGQDCVIATLGEKRVEYHSIGHLEEAMRKLELRPGMELQCDGQSSAKEGGKTRECGHYKYADKPVSPNYVRVMGES